MRIYLDNRVHAKMILVNGSIWGESANLTNCHSMEEMLAISSTAVYAFVLDESWMNGTLDPAKEIVH